MPIIPDDNRDGDLELLKCKGLGSTEKCGAGSKSARGEEGVWGVGGLGGKIVRLVQARTSTRGLEMGAEQKKKVDNGKNARGGKKESEQQELEEREITKAQEEERNG